MGMRRTKVMIHNAPVDLLGDNLTSFLSTYGQVEEVIPLRGTGMANRNYAFILCLKREGFQANSEIIQFRNQKLLIVEGRYPNCWSCRQPEHLAEDCPGKADSNKAQEQSTLPEKKLKLQGEVNWNRKKRLLHQLNLQVIARKKRGKTDKKLGN